MKKTTKKKPAPKQVAPPLLTPLQKAFIAAYRVRGSILEAAKAAEMDRVLHYRWLHVSPHYAEKFSEAKEAVAELLEDEAIRRAYEGWDEPVKYQGEFTYPEELDPETKEIRRVPGAPPLAIRKYSDTLLQFLLKAMKPEKYRERYSAELTGKDGAPLALDNTNLHLLTDAELKQLRAIHEKLAPAVGN